MSGCHYNKCKWCGFAKDCEIKQLKKENKELQEQIENLKIMLQAEREVRCNEDYLKKVTELEDKNEKLQEENKNLRDNYELYKAMAEPTIKELKEKLEHRNCVDCSNHGSNIKLLKAKGIIKKLQALYFSPVVTNDDTKRQDQILAETEQFIKECE